MATHPKAPKRPVFISFEGGEGSGKSTQAALLAQRFNTSGDQALLTREPGGSKAGNILREVLLQGHGVDKGPLAEACLLTSARRDHVEQVIAPALEKGTSVICDRFADSTRIYQGFVGGLPMDTIDNLERVATNGLLPDVTFVILVDQAVANTRRQSRVSQKGDGDDRFERENAQFHANVARGFLWLCDAYPQRCVLIDGDGTQQNVSAAIDRALRARALL